ncbi:MAG: dienelactone hydrolase family protein [Dehalococcoidia bacterium]|nr:dienelactone hydrolase family protein [Dehalococcoidia bacterium]
MCFELDSQPPVPVIAGAAVDSEDATLTAQDGTPFAAFVARGGDTSAPGIVVLPDVRGLYRFYEELALRFGERGYDSVAIDYFGRTAGVGKRGEEFPFREHVAQTTFEGVKQDTRAAVEYLKQDNPDRKVFTVGFCYGGSNSFHQAANGHGLAGVIGFYGHPNRPDFPQGAPAMVERVGDVECPVLGHMGGADQGIPLEEVQRFDEALAAAGVEHELVVYDDAPHSFFDRRYEEYADASAAAWDKTLAFIEAHR